MLKACHILVTMIAATAVAVPASSDVGSGLPDLSAYAAEVRNGMESACSYERYVQGPAAYGRCLREQITRYSKGPPLPDLARYPSEVRRGLESACSNERYVQGPAAYGRCLREQIARYIKGPPLPDLSGYTSEVRQGMESACSNERYVQGPAAYSRCLRDQITSFGRPPEEHERLEDRGTQRPGPRPSIAQTPPAVTAAIQRELARLGYDPGEPDGIVGPRTLRGIKAFQRDRGLPSTGRSSHELLALLKAEPGRQSDVVGPEHARAEPHRGLNDPSAPDEPERARAEERWWENAPLQPPDPERARGGPSAGAGAFDDLIPPARARVEPSPRPNSEPAPPTLDVSGFVPLDTATDSSEADRTRSPEAVLGALPAGHGGSPLTADELFQAVAPSVFLVISSLSLDDLQHGIGQQGSAVAVAPRLLLTNYHIIIGPVIALVQGTVIIAAKVEAQVPNDDRCVIAPIEDIDLRPVRVRLSAGLKIGEKVYTVGSPNGLESTLGEGLISGLRKHAGRRLIQTTAPISPGSSGGGLFDSRGNLIGITTFLLRDAQALNFAIAADEYWARP